MSKTVLFSSKFKSSSTFRLSLELLHLQGLKPMGPTSMIVPWSLLFQVGPKLHWLKQIFWKFFFLVHGYYDVKIKGKAPGLCYAIDTCLTF